MTRRRVGSHLSIQVKFILAFLLTSSIVSVVNGLMYYNINISVKKVDEVYKSNLKMNDFSDALTNVDVSMHTYLETKSSKSIDNYYRNVQKIEKQLEEMEQVLYSEESSMMQEDICNLTRHYLMVTADGIQSKRGRNIEKYRMEYDQAKSELSVIHAFIYSLNREQFQVNSRNYDALTKTLHYLEGICAAMLVLVTLANLILIFVLTRRITKPLKRLADVADQIGMGDLTVQQLRVTSMDEVGVVTNAFNQMTLRLQEYIEQIRESISKENAHKEKELRMESHLKDARLKYLQAQINPHFLFNTLNAGMQLAMMEDAEQTVTFLENTADFFRYNLRKIEEDTSLKEELRLVDHYLYILNVRFSGEIHYTKHVPLEYESLRIPSMILQPIIENAVNHGIRNMEGKGQIILSVYLKDMFVCISISDNGIGMSQEEIKGLLSMKEGKSKNDDSNGIGLINVMKRLEMYYHGQNIVEINSEGEGKGTEIILYMPMLR